MRKIMIIISILIISFISLKADSFRDIGTMYIYKGLPVIDVNINGHDTRLLIDTGSTSSFLDSHKGEEYGFTCKSVGNFVVGLNGVSNIGLASNVKLIINDRRVSLKFKCVDLKGVDRLGIAGIIGSNFFISNNLIIDYKNGLIKTEQ